MGKEELYGFNTRIVDGLFFLISALFMFDEIPKKIQLSTLGGPIADDLVVYPLIAGLLYTAYASYHNKNLLLGGKKFLLFSLLFLAASILSLLNGLIHYPAYDDIAKGIFMVEQSRLHLLFVGLSNLFHVHLGSEYEFMILMGIRGFKSIILYTIYIWCATYMIFCWYYNDAQRGIKVFFKGTMVSLLIFFAFGILNMFALAGCTNIKNFMYQYLYPYILDSYRVIQPNGEWYFRINQLRANLPEPSHVGNYAAAILPLLLMAVYGAKNWQQRILSASVLGIFGVMIFLSQSRTPVLLTLGILVLFGGFSFFINLKNWKVVLLVLGMTAISFCVAVGFIQNYLQIEGASKQGASKQITESKLSATEGSDAHLKGNVASVDLSKKDSQRGGNAPIEGASKQGASKQGASKQEASKQGASKQITESKLSVAEVSDAYLKGNVASVDLSKDSQRGGNAPRKAYIMIHLREGLDYPLLGVGPGLSGRYDLEYVTKEDMKVPEIRKAVNSMKARDEGNARFSLYAQNEYVQRFSENGILGLLIFIFPFAFIYWKLIGMLMKYRKNKEKVLLVLWALIALPAAAVSGLNGSATMMYNIWPVLGLSYAIYYQYKKVA